MPRDRQLAAIMFTDIQGYTAIMQRDEELAIKIRDRHRKIFNSTTEKYKGTILQYFGDGTLSTFKSAIDAVKCAMEMQISFQEEPVIPVRIGIHQGDIVYTEDDIIGDGVNVASRIESLAVPGSVFISDKVYDEVKNHPSIETQSLKTFELKNVKKPIEVYAIANKGLIIPNRNDINGKTKDRDTVSGEKHGKFPKNSIKKYRNNIVWFSAIVLAIVAILYFMQDLVFKQESNFVADQKMIENNQINSNLGPSSGQNLGHNTNDLSSENTIPASDLFTIYYSFHVKKGKSYYEIFNNSEVQKGDSLQVLIKSTVDSYIYIINVDGKNAPSLIYPQDSRNNFLAEHNLLSIPGENEYFLVDEVAGIEKLFFIASKEPIAQEVNELILQYASDEVLYASGLDIKDEIQARGLSEIVKDNDAGLKHQVNDYQNLDVERYFSGRGVLVKEIKFNHI